MLLCAYGKGDSGEGCPLDGNLDGGLEDCWSEVLCVKGYAGQHAGGQLIKHIYTG